MERCVQCGQPLWLVDVHGHLQCRCGFVVSTCCEGSERHGQLPAMPSVAARVSRLKYVGWPAKLNRLA